MKRFLAICGLSLATGMAATHSAPAAARPDILLIMVDDMGWSDIGCYGAEVIQTPNIDRLAAEGLRFRQFYNNAKCTTTRASLLTGLYPRNGGQGIELLDERMVTFSEALRPAGYRTGLSGKWHNGHRTPHRPVDRGFDESYGLWDGACNYFNPARHDPQFKGGKQRFFGEGETFITEFPDDFYTTDAFTDRAIRMMEKFTADERPFLIYLPYTAPHYPIQARPEDIAKYKGRFADGWNAMQVRRHKRAVELGLIDPKWRLPAPDREVTPWADAPIKDWQQLRMETYAAMIDRVDQNIGRLLAALEKTGRARNTLVLFLSDNGSCAETPGGSDGSQLPGPEEFYCHVGPDWAFAQNSPFRRYKSFMHEGGIATPLIARWPAVIQAGGITNTPGHVVDFMPTFLEMAGAPYPETHRQQKIRPLEGVSLLPVLKNPAADLNRPQPMTWAFAGNRGIREGAWKLVWDDGLRHWELYDMVADRTETHDLSAEMPEKTRALREKWESWAKETGVR